MYFDEEFKEAYFPKAKLCLGVDEVGRGPLAGPVVSCAVIALSNNTSEWIQLLDSLNECGVCDSKKLSAKKRQLILQDLNVDFQKLSLNRVYNNALFSFVISDADHAVVDEMNIHHASLFSMKKATELLLENKKGQSLIMVDGKWKIPLEDHFRERTHVEPIIKGDTKSLLIGIASIIAKEYRDSLMNFYDEKYPGYGLGKHSGYPTPAHKLAISELGPCPIHRRTFKGVKEHLLA